LLSFFLPLPVGAAERLALLIGNQAYNENVGPLTNPRKDIELVGAALKTLNFKMTMVPDADFPTLEKAIKSYIATVRESGPDTVSFFYYSGHGASDANTGLNYIIPIDVTNAEDTSLWNNSVELKGDLIDKLVTQAPAAVHFVVFDACRNELQLKVRGKKAFEVDGKGFVPVKEQGSILVAFATDLRKPLRMRGWAAGFMRGDYGDSLRDFARIVAPLYYQVNCDCNSRWPLNICLGSQDQKPAVSFLAW
jgi:uncharacterized caspase-like protein